jgi:hypothetical protein
VVLAGEAAHCASPYSGMGVSGGLVGAYVLAGEIAGHPDDLPTAFKNYDAALRPFVDEIQAQVNHGCWRLACPRAGWRSMPFSPCRAWPHRCTSRYRCAIRVGGQRRRVGVARMEPSCSTRCSLSRVPRWRSFTDYSAFPQSNRMT